MQWPREWMGTLGLSDAILIVLKDKLSHAKTNKQTNMYLSENLFESGKTKPKVIRSTLQTGAGEKTSIEKTQRQSQTIIGLAGALEFAVFGKAWPADGDWLSLSF